MELFNNAKAVRLKSHLDKYLFADDDEETVRQSRNSVSKKARWTVEKVEGNPQAIRLRSVHGRYLTASEESFLLGMTGRKVVQCLLDSKRDGSVEWEPIKEGYRVKLRTKGGKFLRANGAMPPWRNSVTHDLPHRTATQDWVMWDVDIVDVSVLDEDCEYLESGTSVSSFGSVRSSDVSCMDSPLTEAGRSPAPEKRWPSIAAEGTPVTPVERLRSSSLAEEKRWPLTEAGRSPAAEKRWPSIAAEGTPVTPVERLRRSSLAEEKRWPSIGSDRSARPSGRQDGMEFFSKAKSVRLQSHLGKYLIADEDESTVRQSRNGASHRSRWSVEFVDGKRNRIRLKSCHGLYLTASEEPFLLGMTGKKVLQTSQSDAAVEWEPVREGQTVKMMTGDGKFLRANGGAPPWRNSVTHDVPHRTATQSWVLWSVDVLDISLSDPDPDPGMDCLSPASSFSSFAGDYSGSPDIGSPVVRRNGNGKVGNMSGKQVSGMEFFNKAKSVRLKSHHNKYLTADSDEEKVIQDRSGSSKSVIWTVEFVEGVDSVVRLKSCYGRYLRAMDDEYLLGVTGRKVVQSLPRKLDSSVEWEPIRDVGTTVKLKTRYGNFLRANGGLPPWRNSITHDIPHRHRDWILWEVDVIEIQPDSPPKVSRSESLDEDLDSFQLRIPSYKHSHSSSNDSQRKSIDGRLIYYNVADDDGNYNEDEEGSFVFKGHGLEGLSQKLEEETGIEDIIICSKNIVNGKLYPLRLALPPNNATMNVVVVPPTSKIARDFLPPSPTTSS